MRFGKYGKLRYMLEKSNVRIVVSDAVPENKVFIKFHPHWKPSAKKAKKAKMAAERAQYLSSQSKKNKVFYCIATAVLGICVVKQASKLVTMAKNTYGEKDGNERDADT